MEVMEFFFFFFLMMSYLFDQNVFEEARHAVEWVLVGLEYLGTIKEPFYFTL